MTYVVVEACIKCKHTDCVSVCPVDCFYEGENFLAIHPDECIDCNACVPACPVEAIYADDELPSELPPVALNGLPVRYGDDALFTTQGSDPSLQGF